MAEENGNVSDLTIEVLKSIRSELKGLRGEMKEGLAEVREGLDEVREGLTEVRSEVHELRGEVHDLRRGLDDTNAKLDQLADFTQTGFKALLAQGDRRFLDHEGRLRRLEEHAGFEPGR